MQRNSLPLELGGRKKMPEKKLILRRDEMLDLIDGSGF